MTAIKFNPDNKELLTYGEALSPAMEITDETEATQYLADYVSYLTKFKNEFTKGNSAESIAKENLAYFAGYYSDAVRERVERLFICSHPIFGSIKINGSPTGKEAFECGRTGKTLDEIKSTD